MEAAALRRRPLDHLAALGGQPLVEGAVGDPSAHQLGDGLPEGLAVRPRLPEKAGGHAVLLAGQPQQQVFAAHIAVPQPGGVFLGQPDGPQGGGCKAVVRHCGSPRSLHGFGHGSKGTIPSPDRWNVGRLTGNSFLTMPAFCKN